VPTRKEDLSKAEKCRTSTPKATAVLGGPKKSQRKKGLQKRDDIADGDEQEERRPRKRPLSLEWKARTTQQVNSSGKIASLKPGGERDNPLRQKDNREAGIPQKGRVSDSDHHREKLPVAQKGTMESQKVRCEAGGSPWSGGEKKAQTAEKSTP